MSDLVERVPCPVCGAVEAEVLYRAEKRTGTFLGCVEVVLSQCATCGFVFNSPRPTAAAMERYYGEDALASGCTFRGDGEVAYYPALFAERAQFYAPFLTEARRSRQRILDVGCSRGDFLAALRSAGVRKWELCGLEPSARSSDEAAGRGFEVVRGYLGEHRFEDGAFDAISLISVLEHLPDPLAAMRETARMLAPDGIVLLEVPSTLHLELSLTGCFGLEHICHFTPGSLSALLERAGLPEMRLDDRVRDHGLRLVAGRNLARWGVDDIESFVDDREAVGLTVRRYAERERHYLVELEARVGGALERWRTGGKRVAVYGAGAHTVQLGAHFDLRASVDFFVDGDVAKQGTELFGLPVLGPEAIAEREVDAVLVSSHRFVTEMEATVRAFGGEGVEIARCYGARDFELVSLRSTEVPNRSTEPDPFFRGVPNPTHFFAPFNPR